VHLVNSKPSLNGEGIIDGGLQTLDGAAATASFQGTFGGVNVPLGDAETDGDGRLIVRGGFGKSENPTDLSSPTQFPHHPGWYDDVSDGPITAQITIGPNTFQAVNGAWVICPPPRYAPTTYSISSLYDTLRQLAITNQQLPALGLPSFANDIFPILKRALDMRYVSAFGTAWRREDGESVVVGGPEGRDGDHLATDNAKQRDLGTGLATGEVGSGRLEIGARGHCGEEAEEYARPGAARANSNGPRRSTANPFITSRSAASITARS
jgi:hypothetical protein